MRIRSVADLGAAIREHRTRSGMDQSTLAKAAGTSRKWLVEAERGKSRAEIGLILRTLKALGLNLDLASPVGAKVKRATPQAEAILTILASLKKKP